MPGIDGLALIEVMIDRDDCSKDLLEWGRHVAANNGLPSSDLSASIFFTFDQVYKRK